MAARIADGGIGVLGTVPNGGAVWEVDGWHGGLLSAARSCSIEVDVDVGTVPCFGTWSNGRRSVMCFVDLKAGSGFGAHVSKSAYTSGFANSRFAIMKFIPMEKSAPPTSTACSIWAFRSGEGLTIACAAARLSSSEFGPS